MSLQILLNPIRDLLDQQLRGILNTGLISAKVINATSHYSNGYIQLLFDHDDQKYHTPKIFDALSPRGWGSCKPNINIFTYVIWTKEHWFIMLKIPS